jgi:hypothetical protein
VFLSAQCAGGKFENNEMGRNVARMVRRESWWGYLRKTDHLGDQDLDGRIIFEWIFRKLE